MQRGVKIYCSETQSKASRAEEKNATALYSLRLPSEQDVLYYSISMSLTPARLTRKVPVVSSRPWPRQGELVRMLAWAD